jgi:hypothetical protein
LHVICGFCRHLRLKALNLLFNMTFSHELATNQRL